MVVYFYGQNNKFGYFSNFYLSKFRIKATVIGRSEEI